MPEREGKSDEERELIKVTLHTADPYVAAAIQILRSPDSDPSVVGPEPE